MSFGRWCVVASGGGPARVTVPLWQLSDSTSMRTPGANRLNSK
jgi:hypothetical protein